MQIWQASECRMLSVRCIHARRLSHSWLHRYWTCQGCQVYRTSQVRSDVSLYGTKWTAFIESGIIFKKTEMLSAHQLNSWLFLLILYLFLWGKLSCQHFSICCAYDIIIMLFMMIRSCLKISQQAHSGQQFAIPLNFMLLLWLQCCNKMTWFVISVTL